MKIFKSKPTGRPPTAPRLRFWPKVDKSAGPFACWPWLGAISQDGYGWFWISKRKKLRAHRVAYELAVGPIPEGLVLDHVHARGCRSRACVNPAHLEAVTLSENIRRGGESLKTHCPKGHPHSGENLYIQPSNGGRLCRECNRLRARARLAAKRENERTAQGAA